jgi:hypothetical protein
MGLVMGHPRDVRTGNLLFQASKLIETLSMKWHELESNPELFVTVQIVIMHDPIRKF